MCVCLVKGLHPPLTGKDVVPNKLRPSYKAWHLNKVITVNCLILNLFYRDVALGDLVTAGQCRPLSKTVRFNVLKVSKGKGSKEKKTFEKF